jgi:hypothetical protein
MRSRRQSSIRLSATKSMRRVRAVPYGTRNRGKRGPVC